MITSKACLCQGERPGAVLPGEAFPRGDLLPQPVARVLSRPCQPPEGDRDLPGGEQGQAAGGGAQSCLNHSGEGEGRGGRGSFNLLFVRTPCTFFSSSVLQARDATGNFVRHLVSSPTCPVFAYHIEERFDIGGLDTYLRCCRAFEEKAP